MKRSHIHAEGALLGVSFQIYIRIALGCAMCVRRPGMQ